MNAVQITKTFQTRTGKNVVVTGRLELEKTVWADGHNCTVPTCEIHIDVNVEGIGSQGGWVREMTPAQQKQAPASGYTHYVGKLALTTEQAELIEAVRSELEQHPAWQEKTKRAKIAKQALEKMEASRRNSAGWCERCEDWTYGDCGHN